MRNINEQQSLKPSTIKATVFLLLFMLWPMKQAQSQAPPTGPAGGDLTGTYPNPTLGVDRVRKTGDTMSGAIGITLPNPGAIVVPFTLSTTGNPLLNRGLAMQFQVPSGSSGGVGFSTLGGQITNAWGANGQTYMSFGALNSSGTFGEIFRMDGRGVIGIGTATPSTNYKLDVNGEINATGFRINGTPIATGGPSQWTTSGSNIYFNTGNVGLGTTSPNALLDLASTTQYSNRIRISGQEYYQAGNTSTHGIDIRLGTNRTGERQIWFADSANAINATTAQLRMRFQGTYASLDSISTDGATTLPMGLNASGGNVGIGKTAPGTKLDVAGTIRGGNADTNIGNHPSHGTSYSALWRQGADYSLLTEGTHTFLNAPVATGNIYFRSANADKMFLQGSTGNVGIGTLAPAARLDVVGSVNASGNLNVVGTITGGTIHAKYQDVAEWVESSQSLAAGTVVVLDHTKSNQVVASTEAYDTRVAGVISAQPGITLGESGAEKVLVATTGRVKIKVDATNSPIQVGDLLVTGDKEGFAMKSLPVNIGGMQLHRPGTLVGKALEPLARGTGEILVLLSLQ